MWTRREKPKREIYYGLNGHFSLPFLIAPCLLLQRQILVDISGPETDWSRLLRHLRSSHWCDARC